jgi:hypothetical protein
MNVPVAFVSLKTLNLFGVDFRNNAMVSFIIQIIQGSPSLQMLEIRVSGMHMYQIHHLKFPWLCMSILSQFEGFIGK